MGGNNCVRIFHKRNKDDVEEDQQPTETQRISVSGNRTTATIFTISLSLAPLGLGFSTFLSEQRLGKEYLKPGMGALTCYRSTLGGWGGNKFEPIMGNSNLKWKVDEELVLELSVKVLSLIRSTTRREERKKRRKRGREGGIGEEREGKQGRMGRGKNVQSQLYSCWLFP